MEEKAINVVLVGCGAVSQSLHVPALKSMAARCHVEVFALVDPLASERAKIQEEFPAAKGFSQLDECPIDSNNLVVIATPPKLHSAQAIYSLKRGASVLCEKPMANSTVECQSMIQAANESGSILAVGLVRRFFPVAEALKELIEKKTFGKLVKFDVAEGGKLGWGAVSDSLFRPGVTGGGVLFDMGTHVIDFLLSVIGEPSEFSYMDDSMGGVEANCSIEMIYRGGMRGNVRLSWDSLTANRHVYKFENATVIYNTGWPNHLTYHFDGIPFAFDSEISCIDPSDNWVTKPVAGRTISQSFTEQLENVVDAMRGSSVVRVSGDEGMRSIKFIEACYSRRQPMKMDWLEPSRSSGFSQQTTSA